MSNATAVLGKIEVPMWPGWENAWEVNRSAIDSLSPRDSWPHLCASMFSMNDAAPAYNCRLVHFAATMKGIEEAWAEWIAKLEALLRTMSWISVDVHLDTEYLGTHAFWWVATDPEPGLPVVSWERGGGPWTYAEFESASPGGNAP